MSSSSGNKVHLKVNSADAGTEIYIIDSTFQLAGRGLGRVELDLDPGIYKMKVRVGFDTIEEYLVLRGDLKEEVKTIPALKFSSAAPLTDTARESKEQIEIAEREAGKVHISHGKGSWLCIFTRDWIDVDKSQPVEQRQANPAHGLTVRSIDGEEIVDLGKETAKKTERGQCVACNIEVDPGAYLLRLQISPGNSLERVLIASRGWQTQFFRVQRGDDTSADGVTTGFSEACLLMRNGIGFEASDPSARLVELARLALMNELKVTPEQVRSIIEQGDDNPMLGIYLAHLLLLSQEPDKALLESIIEKLRSSLGEHPDVEALAFKSTGVLPRTKVFSTPPLFRRSWNYMVEATSMQTDLAPRESLSATVASRLWSAGPWIIWMPPGAKVTEPSLESSADIDVDNIQEAIMTAVETYLQLISKSVPRSVSKRLTQHSSRFLSLDTITGLFEDLMQSRLLDSLKLLINKLAGMSIGMKRYEAGELPKKSGKPVKTVEDLPSDLASDAAGEVQTMDEEKMKKLVTAFGIPRANMEDLLEKIKRKTETRDGQV